MEAAELRARRKLSAPAPAGGVGAIDGTERMVIIDGPMSLALCPACNDWLVGQMAELVLRAASTDVLAVVEQAYQQFRRQVN